MNPLAAVISPPKSTSFLPVLGSLMLFGFLVLGFLLRARPELAWSFQPGCGGRSGSERNASTSLKTIVSAQFDYCSNDRDGNDVKDFWRGDVAGLYTGRFKADPKEPAMKLIELSVASADDRPVSDLTPYAVRSPKAGYWFRAILHEEEIVPSPERFAACAFPDTRSAGKWTYIVSEENYIYRKDLGSQRGVERYPRDPVQAGWQRLD
jgi:hypothetical protein